MNVLLLQKLNFKEMKKAIASVLLSLSMASMVKGQSEMSVFTATGRAGVATTFVTDYQSIGINPANLGWSPKYEGKKVTLSLLEGSYSAFSGALSKPEFRNSIMNYNSDSLTHAEKVQAARDFIEQGLAINADIMALGFSINLGKAGGVAFMIRDRFQWYSIANETTSQIMFLGYNAPYFDTTTVDANNDTVGIASNPKMYSEILDGSKFKLSWYREFALSYGKQFIDGESFKLYAGAGVKYISGLAYMNIESENGKFTAFSALTPGFDINYGAAAVNNPSTVTQSGNLPNSVGHGLGFDLGVSVEINEKLKIGASITDIGSITWDGNVYQASDDTLISLKTEGFNSYNLFTEAENFVGENGVFTWTGVPSVKTNLPTKIRFGASYELIEDKLNMGLDIVSPMNQVSGNFEKMLIAYGLDFKILKWATISTGFYNGGNYGFNIPVGLTVNTSSGSWEAGIASRDAVTFFTNNNPTLSLAFGFLRIRM